MTDKAPMPPLTLDEVQLAIVGIETKCADEKYALIETRCMTELAYLYRVKSTIESLQRQLGEAQVNLDAALNRALNNAAVAQAQEERAENAEIEAAEYKRSLEIMTGYHDAEAEKRQAAESELARVTKAVVE